MFWHTSMTSWRWGVGAGGEGSERGKGERHSTRRKATYLRFGLIVILGVFFVGFREVVSDGTGNAGIVDNVSAEVVENL